MNRDEKIVFDFLKKTDGSNVVFEPNGNIPPDFIINSKIAIEVRRLNQHFFSKGKSEGLETLYFQLFGAFKEVLVPFDPIFSGKSYWVFLEFQRPFRKSIKIVIKEMQTALSYFINSNYVSLPHAIQINESIELEIYDSSPIKRKIFRPGGSIDSDSGGFVVSTYLENIHHCIINKSEKIKFEKDKYKFWHLFLVDHLNLGLDFQDINDVKKMVDTLGEFDKVVLLNLNGEIIFEINNLQQPF